MKHKPQGFETVIWWKKTDMLRLNIQDLTRITPSMKGDPSQCDNMEQYGRGCHYKFYFMYLFVWEGGGERHAPAAKDTCTYPDKLLLLSAASRLQTYDKSVKVHHFIEGLCCVAEAIDTYKKVCSFLNEKEIFQ